jgi:hypothetical protein
MHFYLRSIQVYAIFRLLSTDLNFKKGYRNKEKADSSPSTPRSVIELKRAKESAAVLKHEFHKYVLFYHQKESSIMNYVFKKSLIPSNNKANIYHYKISYFIGYRGL